MIHVHDWALAEDPAGPIGYLCVECGDRTPACNTCGRPTESSLLICERCLAHERRVLADIAHAFTHYLPPVPTVIKAVRYDGDPVTGSTVDAVPFGIGANEDSTGEGIIRTPDGVLDVLGEVATDWADELGYTVNLPVLEFLTDHLLWAAQNPDASGWDAYRQEARQMRHTARRIAGLLPARALAPCIHCGGQVVQDWADPDWEPNEEGLSDVLRCTGCGTTWGDREKVTSLAVRGKIHTRDYHPEGHVTEAQARRMFDLGTSTVRLWVRRGKVRHIARDAAGRKLYRVGDLQQLAEPTMVETTG